jgi:hypothetical protein
MHAASIVALLEYGEVRPDEPLLYAESRMKEKLASRFQTQIAAYFDDNDLPRKLNLACFREICFFVQEDYPEREWVEPLQRAPHWLLNFSGVERDAEILGFELPDLSGAPKLGRFARRDRDRWPFLPQLTIDAGGSCDEPDPLVATVELLRRNIWSDWPTDSIRTAQRLMRRIRSDRPRAP